MPDSASSSGATATTPNPLDDLTRRLLAEFSPHVPADVVQEHLRRAASAYEGARITTYVPVLVDREVRARLRDLTPR